MNPLLCLGLLCILSGAPSLTPAAPPIPTMPLPPDTAPKATASSAANGSLGSTPETAATARQLQGTATGTLPRRNLRMRQVTLRPTAPIPSLPADFQSTQSGSREWVWLGTGVLAVLLAVAGVFLLARRGKPKVPPTSTTYDPYG